jgi:excisionase family DNA binding protein
VKPSTFTSKRRITVTVPLTKLFYKPHEAAELLSRGRTAVYQAMAAGELRSCSAGRSRLIPAEALREYAEKLAAEAQ